VECRPARSRIGLVTSGENIVYNNRILSGNTLEVQKVDSYCRVVQNRELVLTGGQGFEEEVWKDGELCFQQKNYMLTLMQLTQTTN
jgi:hypothetical protein